MTNKKQQGTSLIEVLIATVIASGVLISGSRLFLDAQSQSYQLMKKIELIQTLYQTLFMLRAEVRRSGYNQSVGSSLKLSGASKIIETSGNWIDFVSTSPDGDWYKTRYQQDVSQDTLDLCIQRVAAHLPVPSLGNCSSNFFSLFDESNVELTQFSVAQSAIGGTGSSLVSIRMDLSTHDESNALSQTILIKQRNWQ